MKERKISLMKTWQSVLLWLLTMSLSGFVVSAYFLFQNLNTLINNGESRYTSYLLSDELRQSSDDLTRMARTFAATGNQRFEAQFREVLAIRNGERARPDNYNRIYWDLLALSDELPANNGDVISLQDMMIREGISDDELELLRLAQTQSDALVALEEVAMRAVNNTMTVADEHHRQPGESNQAMAIRLLHGADYHQAKAVIMEPINMFLIKLDERTRADFIDSANRAQTLFILCVLLSILASIFALATAFLGRRISGSEQSSLAQALESEKKFSGLQQKFVSLVSHEFRTPLSIIDGTAQRIIRLRDEITPDQLVERSGKIRFAVERMVGLIEATLYTSRLDAGKIEMHVQPCAIRELLAEICDHQKEISTGHDISVDLDGIPELVDADPKLLEHVFTNLLSNAVKYAPDSPLIEITGKVDGDAFLVSIKDQGLGIPEDDLPHMFERYFRAKTAQGIQGTGIGLSVCREFVEMHGGTIEVASVEGEGATFTVLLPIGGKDQ